MNFSRRQFLRTSAAMSALSAVGVAGSLSLSGTARAADAITVQYGGSAWLGHYPAYLAMKTGAFAAAGINQQWQSFGTSSARMSAVLSGGIDIACTGIVSALALMARGSKHFSIVAIPDSFSRVEGLLVRDSVRSLQDLKGKKVGVTFASSSHLLVLDLLGSAGLSNDVTLLNVPAPELPGAIQSGQIDAAAVWAPQFNRIRAMSGMKVLADDTQFSLHKKYGVTPGPDVLIVRNAWAEKNVDTVRKYLRVYFEASQMLRTKPEEAARSLIALTGMSALDQLEAIKDAEWYSLEQQTQLLKSPGTYVDGLQRLAEMLVTYKQIDKAPAVRRWVNTSYL